MIQLKSIVSLFEEKRWLIPRVVSLLQKEGLLQTIITAHYINLLSLDDGLFEQEIDSEEVIVKANQLGIKLTRLLLVYNKFPVTDETREYLNSLPDKLYSRRKLLSIHISLS